ncbi:MAG TPA: cysteine rich repeat-containing protein [Xanthomonadales bacterium]|nr:cysteine rich repeat-containing protein [Xanthomonadales bacterium]
MNKLRIAGLALVFVVSGSSVQAQDPDQDPLEFVMEGCGVEIENYCSQVTLGEGRLAACFFAHEDKLSTRCQHTLYDMALALDQAMNAMVYIATECEADIDTFCADVEPGDGAILNCLSAEREKISEQCSTALSDVEEE